MLQAAPNHDAHWDEEAPASQQQPDVGLRGRRRQVVPLETLNSAANCCCVVLGRGSLLPRPRWPLLHSAPASAAQPLGVAAVACVR